MLTCWGDWSRQFSLVFFGYLFVLFSSVIYFSHLNSSCKLLLCGRKKKLSRLCVTGSSIHSQAPLHRIDMATRDQRMKNSGAFHWLNHPSYPVKYNSMKNYFNVSPVNFWTVRVGKIVSHERGATPGATDSSCASSKETLNITAPFFSTASHRFSPSSFSCQTFPLSK